jgi:hypothetical protein
MCALRWLADLGRSHGAALGEIPAAGPHDSKTADGGLPCRAAPHHLGLLSFLDVDGTESSCRE